MTAGSAVSTLSSLDRDQPDSVLVATVGRGDSAAFRLLVDRYSATLYRLAYRMLNDANEAEDVTQDAFLKLWTHAAGWREMPGGGLIGWLRRIATNACFDRLRRRRFTSDEAVPDRIDETPGVEEAIGARDLSALASGAVNALPERQKAAIVLTYYEELSNAVAAETLGMHVKAFESLLLRARTALRQAMTEAGVGAADLGATA